MSEQTLWVPCEHGHFIRHRHWVDEHGGTTSWLDRAVSPDEPCDGLRPATDDEKVAAVRSLIDYEAAAKEYLFSTGRYADPDAVWDEHVPVNVRAAALQYSGRIVDAALVVPVVREEPK